MKRILVCLLAMSMGEMWSVQTSGIDTNLRGVSVVVGKLSQDTTVWASGSNGVILRSVDSGGNWERLNVAEGSALDFRGVQAIDQNNAYVMSSGEGEKSRIYRTTDGGKTWELQYTAPGKEFFLDGIVCSSSTNCFALSDPVDGRFVLLRTENGKQWKEMSSAGMPPALPKEGVFAASNSSLILYGKTELYFATGGPAARVFHSDDLGKSWTVAETPVLSGKAPQGIFSLARMDDTVVAVGGDYEKAEQRERVAAYSLDRGKTWKLATKMPGGYRSSVAALGPGFIAAGPNGSDMSKDGIEWVPAGKLGMNAMAVAGNKAWAVGANGVVAESNNQK